MHHLLDFFKETHVDIYNIELVFTKFLQNKVIYKFINDKGEEINFKEDINELFQILRENKQHLYNDLKGSYLLNLEKTNNKNKKKFED